MESAVITAIIAGVVSFGIAYVNNLIASGRNEFEATATYVENRLAWIEKIRAATSKAVALHSALLLDAKTGNDRDPELQKECSMSLLNLRLLLDMQAADQKKIFTEFRLVLKAFQNVTPEELKKGTSKIETDDLSEAVDTVIRTEMNVIRRIAGGKNFK